MAAAVTAAREIYMKKDVSNGGNSSGGSSCGCGCCCCCGGGCGNGCMMQGRGGQGGSSLSWCDHT